MIWQHSIASFNYPMATPAVDGGMLFVLTPEGVLHGLDALTGRDRWQKDIVATYGAVKPTYGFAGSPVIEGGLVILTANSAGMAVKRNTGELAWASEKPPADFKSANRMDITGTGYSTWHFGWDVEPAYASADPVVFGDKVCMSLGFQLPLNQSGFLLQVGSEGTRELWRTPELFGWYCYPLVIDEQVYSMHGGPNGLSETTPTSLRCFDPQTGRLRWEEPFGETRRNKSISLAAAHGILIVLDDRGTLCTAQSSPEGFKEIARCDVLQGANKPRLFWTPPVLCNAKIYCRNFSGDLVCIDVSNERQCRRPGEQAEVGGPLLAGSRE